MLKSVEQQILLVILPKNECFDRFGTLSLSPLVRLALGFRLPKQSVVLLLLNAQIGRKIPLLVE